MSRPKSVIKNLSITRAHRSHDCHNAKSHRIPMGDRRLTIKEGRSELHYCLACAGRFLESGLERLRDLLREVRQREATEEGTAGR